MKFRIFFTIIITFLACYCLFTILKILTADILFTKGLGQVNQGQWQKGIVKLEQSIILNPNEPTYWRYLGKVYAKLALFYPEEKNLQVQADILLSKAFDLNSQNLLTLKSIFWGYMDLVDTDAVYLDQVENFAHKLVKLSPSDPTGYYYAGLVYEKRGDVSKAKRFLEKAVGLKRDYKEAVDKLQELSREITKT